MKKGKDVLTLDMSVLIMFYVHEVSKASLIDCVLLFCQFVNNVDRYLYLENLK